MNKYNATYIVWWIGAGIAFLIMLVSWSSDPLLAAFMFIAFVLFLFAGIGAYKGVKNMDRYKNRHISEYERIYNEVNRRASYEVKNHSPVSEQYKKTYLVNNITLNGKEYELKYNYDTVKVAGAGMPAYEEAVRFINAGDELKLKAEPDNQNDPRAVAVLSSDNKTIGYLHKGTLQDMANDYLRMKKPIVVFAENKPVTTITLGFYGKPSIPKKEMYLDRLEKANGYAVYKLTSNLNDDMQECIALMEAGDPIKAEYDEEKQRFLITDENGLELGYLKNKNLSDIDSACVESVELNDDDKYIIKIAIF